jgi:predicted secreted hydrolase
MLAEEGLALIAISWPVAVIPGLPGFPLPGYVSILLVVVWFSFLSLPVLHWMEEEITGWYWFSIQLEDHTELMIYRLRLKTGGFSPASSGTFVKSSGGTSHLSHEGFFVDVLDRWESPRSGASYPSRWRVFVKPLQIELSIVSILADQELITERTARVTHWEGSVSISGHSGNNPVRGVGYVEMTGYAAPFNLTPSP